MSTKPVKPLTVRDIAAKKAAGERLVVLTAYDALFGRLVDEAGVDIVLVGDSLGNVVAGHDSTLPVTLSQMIYHASAVRRGVKRAMIVVDMPFLTYQVSIERAILTCGHTMQRSNAGGVKLEGGNPSILATVEAVVRAGIPVMGHIGFTPQSVHTIGGARVQGRDPAAAKRLMAEAKGLEAAGAFSIVLELVPAKLAAEITAAISIPTIGIGAGVGCSGQVLVLHDLLGLNDDFNPKFVKRYASLAEEIRSAVSRWADEVRSGAYPDDEHSF
jgi:3-methyl-2-oxobutanoate hydroxymethyltransferase